jgi:hypothetical protein
MAKILKRLSIRRYGRRSNAIAAFSLGGPISDGNCAAPRLSGLAPEEMKNPRDNRGEEADCNETDGLKSAPVGLVFGIRKRFAA